MTPTRPVCHPTWLALLPALALFLAPPAARATEAECLEARLDAVGAYARGLISCAARGARSGKAVDPDCAAGQESKFDEALDAADAAFECAALSLPEASRADASRVTRELVRDLVPKPNKKDACASAKLKAAGARIRGVLKAHARAAVSDDATELADRLKAAQKKFKKQFKKSGKASRCRTSGDRKALQDYADTFADFVLANEEMVALETVLTPSGAEPAETPGTAGVDALIYPKLVVMYGGTDFSLNNAVYTRVYYKPGTTPPDAILVLVPGFEGGAMTLKILAENLVNRAMGEGFRLEVWLIDRRGHQLEDLEGLQIAEDNLDPQIGLDWMFGGPLGLDLSPELEAGPGRRVRIHNPQKDTAFMANWTSLVFSRDIDAVVEAARAWAVDGNVFLGGHSAGTGFTARYASTDFDFAGAGPADPGYAKLRGLVLLEGGGGSASGEPPTEDELDRMEDKFDGGLFHAVRDDAPRCVDGSPCTLATEDVDCAELGNGTCTEPAPAYTVLGLGAVPFLNPRVFGASEVISLQGAVDPDEGQVIVTVEQGGVPGNTAVARVNDLAAFGLLEPATVTGFGGTFLDDDSPIEALLPAFLQVSGGAPLEPEGDELLSWQTIDQRPIPAEFVPDNGPPPTDIPGQGEDDRWGQEVEVTRVDRVLQAFFVGESNFLDWYYPSAGPSTTSGLAGLDSTPLSVGRGRRDIENMTQAANIDIPVIALGGSNGLTPLGADFLAFAGTLAPCAAPSCDGTPRVIDAGSPNPAFPTFGGVAGGYEVVISEGIAHADMGTLEDDRRSVVHKSIIRFLQRNVQ